MRFGVVGVGGEGRRHLDAALRNPRLTVTAVADADEAVARRCAEELGVRWFADHRALLEADVVDVASVAVPHHLLAPVAADLLDGGVHTIVEKPVAGRVSSIDRLAAAARRADRRLGVRLQYRAFRTNALVKALVDGGRVGSLRRVLWVDHAFRPQHYFDRATWRGSWAQAGGGSLLSHHVHHLDLLNWTTGRQPREVSALAIRQLHDVPFEDAVGATLLYDDGLVASWQTSYNEPSAASVRQFSGDEGVVEVTDLPAASVDLPARVRVGRYDRSLHAHLGARHDPGRDQVTVEWSEVQRPRPRVADRLRARRQPEPPTWPTWLDRFVDAVEAGTDPVPGIADARAAIEVANAMVLSTLMRRTVALPLDPAEYDAAYDRLCRGELRLPGA